MGNKASIAELPPEWEDILPNITREDIVRSGSKRCRVEEDKLVYLDDDLFDLDEHVPMALAILRAHPHLKGIRFKLVPGHMTEEQWWAALFGILHDGGIDIEDVVGKIDDDYETGDEVDDTLELGDEEEEDDELTQPLAQSPNDQPVEGENGKKLGRTPIAHLERAYYDDGDGNASESGADETNPPYLKEIKSQQAHIARLQKSLREANHKARKLAMELHKERQKRHEEGTSGGGGGEDAGKEDHSGSSMNSCPRCNSLLTPQHPHSGSWEMHPDCMDFMKLDDHLKENLRKEKEKRMNEVRSQMKFILDTDDIKDSNGKWSCCGKEEYEAECGQ